MKKKAMLSQPMAGKTEEEIVETRNRAIATLEAMGYEVVNTLFTDEWYSRENLRKRGVVQIPLCFLAKSLENMSLCHAAYFCKGWENARGCRIEHDVASAYGLEILYEEIMTENEIHEEYIKIQANELKRLMADLQRAEDERDWLLGRMNHMLSYMQKTLNYDADTIWLKASKEIGGNENEHT